MSKIVSIDPASRAREQRKADLLEVLDEMRRQIEEEEITEFVAVSIDEDGGELIFSKEKFAELIVRDCALTASIMEYEGRTGIGAQLLDNFEVKSD